MDKANIHLYKDGDDIILVFKNASTEVSDLIKSLIQTASVKEISNVESPEEEVVKPVDEIKTKTLKVITFGELKGLTPEQAIKSGRNGFLALLEIYSKNKILNEELKNNTKHSLIGFYNTSEKELFNSLRAMKKNDLIVFLKDYSSIAKNVIDEEMKKGTFTDIDTFVNMSSEYVVRGVCFKVANFVKNILL